MAEMTEVETYKIIEKGKAIQCVVCSYVSHNENDIKFKYCGMCHDFHEAPTKKLKRFQRQFKKDKPSKEKRWTHGGV